MLHTWGQCSRSNHWLTYFIWLTLVLAGASANAQVTNASFSGTYTWLFGNTDSYTIQTNQFGQQVGFCSNNGSTQLPFGYSCNPDQKAYDLITGTLVADGKGNFVTGSTFTFTRDPNTYQCSVKHTAVSPCPYKVPAGKTWSSTTAYVVGNEVDFTVNAKLLTYQAVKNNTNVPPNSSACTSTIQPPNCSWDQLYVSATGGTGVTTGTITGTYALQSNGSGVASVTPSTGGSPLTLAIVVPAAPLAVGQQVAMQGMPTLANEAQGSGTAVRSQ